MRTHEKNSQFNCVCVVFEWGKCTGFFIGDLVGQKIVKKMKGAIKPLSAAVKLTALNRSKIIA